MTRGRAASASSSPQSQGDLAATLRFLFRFEWGDFTARAALDALGLGFFSIGVGFGLMITYAGYAGAAIPLRQVALATVAIDTAISLLAGLAVFPLVFAHGLDPAAGPGLVFVTLPIAFARMPLGAAAATVFSHWRPTPFELIDHLSSNVIARLRFMLRWVTPALIAATAIAPVLS